MKKRINANIEFYRFVFACIIYLYHFRAYTDQEVLHGDFSGGYLGVEFFFVLSGYYFAKSCFNKKQSETSLDFWKKRVKRLYPEYILSIILLLACSWIADRGEYNIIGEVTHGWPDFFCLQTFFVNRNINSLLWFVSVNLWVSFVIYLLYKHSSKKAFASITLCSVISIISVLLIFVGHLDVTQNTYFYLDGFLRGLAEMLSGTLGYIFVCTVSDGVRNITSYSFIAPVLMVITVIITFLCGENRFDFFVLFLMLLLVISEDLAFEKRKSCNVMRDRVFIYLGSISYSLYLNQVLVQKIVHTLFPGRNYWIMAIISLIVTCVLSGILQQACLIGRKLGSKEKGKHADC